MSELFRIYGHRGSPKRRAENTIDSFQEALRAGADGFETDLRLLADGTAILFHDDELRGRDVETLGVNDFASGGVRIDPLKALGRFAGRTTMILEVKRSGWEDVLCSEVSEWNNIVVASFDHELIAALAARPVPFPLGLTLSGRVVGLVEYAESVGATWLFPGFRHTDAKLVAKAHEHGMKVVPWTPNSAWQWERLRTEGCDGIITDVPDEAVAWREASRRSAVGSRQ